MKQLKITVNGTVYDVLVEETGSSSATTTVAPVVAAPTPVATASAPAEQAPTAAAPATTGCDPIVAPMPGVILSVAVSAGQSVKKGDVLCTLEAMKMENEIFAPCDGVVSAVSVAKGESVESGQTLVTLS